MRWISGLAFHQRPNPVHLARDKSPVEQFLVAAHDHAVPRAVNLDNVERLADRHSQSFALPDGVLMHALMLAQHAPAG